MSVVITTYTLASGLMQQGMTLVAGDGHDPPRQHHRAGADDPERARRHEVRRVVSRALPRQLRRARRQRPGHAARDRRLRLVRHPDLDRRARAAHAARAPRGRRGPACRATSGSRSRSSGSCRSRSSSAGSKASSCSRAGRRRCCSAAARCCSAGRFARGGGLGHILSESARLQTAHAPFWQLFPAALTANVGYWATLSLNIPDFTRYARSQRSQVLGQALGLPTTMTAFAFIGVAVTSATIVIFGEAIWDPVALIARIGSAAGHHLRRAGRARRAAHDQHGGQRRVAGQRLLEPGAAAHQLRDRRPHHRGDRHRR